MDDLNAYQALGAEEFAFKGPEVEVFTAGAEGVRKWFWEKIARPILDWLVDNYGSAIIGALLMVGAGFWTWSAEHEYLPIFLVALGTFVAGIWGINGVLWLRRERRPSKARMTFDYSYGLTLDEVTPSHDQENIPNNLEFRFVIRNVAPGPIKYKAERIDVVISDRIKTIRNIAGILPRTSWIMLKVGGFEKEVIDSLNDRTSGSYEYSIVYGHPEDDYSRRAKKRIHFDLVKKDGKVTGAPWMILEESDETI